MNMRLFRVLFGFFWFVGGVGNPLFSSERISCEPLEEEASWSVCLQDGLDSLLQDELLLTSQLGLSKYVSAINMEAELVTAKDRTKIAL